MGGSTWGPCAGVGCSRSSPAGQVSRRRVARVALRGGAVVVHGAGGAEGCSQQLHGDQRQGRLRGRWGAARGAQGPAKDNARARSEVAARAAQAGPAAAATVERSRGRARAWRLPGLPRQRGEAGGARAAGARPAEGRWGRRGGVHPDQGAVTPHRDRSPAVPASPAAAGCWEKRGQRGQSCLRLSPPSCQWVVCPSSTPGFWKARARRPSVPSLAHYSSVS